jgi:hypothetical protein
MKKKRALYFLLPALSFVLGGIYAAEPGWYARASRSSLCLQEERSLPAGHYVGNGILVKIDPYLATPRATQMEVTFPAGTVLEDVTLNTTNGGVVNLNNCILRRVAFKMTSRGSFNLTGCALEDCYVSNDKGVFRRSNGVAFTIEEMYAEIGPPKLTMTDCVVAGSTLASPFLCGMAAKRCTFVSCELESYPLDGSKRSTRYEACLFDSTKFTGTDVLLTTSQCRFTQCECLDVLSRTAANFVVAPVVLKLAWEKGNPDLPDKTANGKVSFEKIAASFPAGSSQAHEWDGSHLKVASLPDAGATPQQLQQVWKLIDMSSAVANANNNAPAAPQGAVPAGNNAVITGTPSAAGVVFKSRINQVNGLLISQLSSGGEAGQVTRMNLTALPSLGESPSTLKFNQDVGESMGKALNEVSKFSQLRHGGWPVGHSLEIGFEDKYIGKDGPSAAVACALLLEAALTGRKWDPAFAVTGDMNADGSVQPIGGVQAKIRGATKGSCKLMGVPVKNEKSVMDLLVLEGPAPLVGITVFGITSFEDALLLAGTERPPALQSALTDFDNMRTVMMKDPRQIMPLLRTPHAAQRLQALLTAAPNCYSAKYLLLYLQGRGPRTLSIGGSIEAAQNSAQSVVSAIDHDVDANVSSLKGDELGNSLYKLRQVRPLLDARVWPYVDGLVAYGEVIRGALLNPVRSGARYTDLVSKANKAAGTVKAAYDKLINDSQVREELGL